MPKTTNCTVLYIKYSNVHGSVSCRPSATVVRNAMYITAQLNARGVIKRKCAHMRNADSSGSIDTAAKCVDDGEEMEVVVSLLCVFTSRHLFG